MTTSTDPAQLEADFRVEHTLSYHLSHATDTGRAASAILDHLATYRGARRADLDEVAAPLATRSVTNLLTNLGRMGAIRHSSQHSTWTITTLGYCWWSAGTLPPKFPT